MTAHLSVARASSSAVSARPASKPSIAASFEGRAPSRATIAADPSDRATAARIVSPCPVSRIRPSTRPLTPPPPPSAAMLLPVMSSASVTTGCLRPFRWSIVTLPVILPFGSPTVSGDSVAS